MLAECSHRWAKPDSQTDTTRGHQKVLLMAEESAESLRAQDELHPHTRLGFLLLIRAWEESRTQDTTARIFSPSPGLCRTRRSGRPDSATDFTCPQSLFPGTCPRRWIWKPIRLLGLTNCQPACSYETAVIRRWSLLLVTSL